MDLRRLPTLVLGGLMAFTIQYMVASTHTFGGVNYGDAFHLSMTLIGIGLILAGLLVALGEWKRLGFARKRQ